MKLCESCKNYKDNKCKKELAPKQKFGGMFSCKRFKKMK